MTLQFFGRLAGVLALTVGLAGCMDMAMDIEVLSETEAKATTTSTMGAEIYTMVKAQSAGASSEDSEDGFCQEEGAQLTENADGSATCVQTMQGKFDELDLGEDGSASFTVVSPGVVRVAFKTEDMKSELGTDEQDEQTKAMMLSLFEGHAITIRIGGREVIDTNMTLAGDRKSAETVIPFLDLINGTVDLPDELFAVVKTN